MFCKVTPYFLDGLAKSMAGPALSNPSGNLVCEAIQGFLIHLLIDTFIRENPDFSFEKGEKEENPCILLRPVKSSLKKSPLSPQSNCFLCSPDSDKRFF